MRSASGYGSGWRRTPSTTRKMAAFAPRPSASAMIERAAKPGRRINARHAYLKLFKAVGQPIPILYDGVFGGHRKTGHGQTRATDKHGPRKNTDEHRQTGHGQTRATEKHGHGQTRTNTGHGQTRTNTGHGQ